ncbi:MAG TPA: NAD(P)-binding domain-containing protein [Albitalea sp.]|nr:NAD(P)-binding domain-containing protein [Albitalea sp.]
MKIGVLGTGMVGEAIATRLVELGHDVMMGSRERGNAKAQAWAGKSGGKAGSFADAAAHAELVFNCTLGSAAVEAVKAAGASRLAGKVLIDVSNPLDFSRGMPPSLFVCNTDSLGETLQREFPQVRVVKALNTTNAQIMVNPARIKGTHHVFMSGNDAEAKKQVAELLRSFGWKEIIDLGDITTARGTEQLLPIWIRLWGTLGTADFNFAIQKA